HHHAQRFAGRLSELPAADLRCHPDRVHVIHAWRYCERSAKAFGRRRGRLSRRRSMTIRVALLLLLMLVSTAFPASGQQPGVTDKEILVGGSNSFSGPLAFTGEQITKFGVDLYFKVVND